MSQPPRKPGPPPPGGPLGSDPRSLPESQALLPPARPAARQLVPEPAAPRRPPAAGAPLAPPAFHPSGPGQTITLPGDQPTLNPAKVYLQSLESPRSRRSMLSSLRTLVRLAELAVGLPPGSSNPDVFPWHKLRYQHTSQIRALLLEAQQQGLTARATANRHLAALRGVLGQVWQLGYASHEEMARAGIGKGSLKSLKGSDAPAGRMLSAVEFQQLWRAAAGGELDLAGNPVPDSCRAPAAVARDRALLALAWATGLRLAELASLDVDTWEPAKRSFTARVKGDKLRTVYLPPRAGAAIEAWLKVRGAAPGALFFPIHRSGRVLAASEAEDAQGTVTAIPRRLTDEGIADVLEQLRQTAAVAPFSPHDFRRTFISNLLEKTDLVTVQRLVGHKRVETTAGYDRRPEAKRREVSQLTDVPEEEP